MAWYDALTGAAFRDWVAEVAGGHRVHQGQRLDPFATSMRNFTKASQWLTNIRARQPLEDRGGSGGQNLTDLKSAELATSEAALSSLGTNVLARWEASRNQR